MTNRGREFREVPKMIYWLPMRHSCGCAREWGIGFDHDNPPDELIVQAKHELSLFVLMVQRHPCPQHGSTTGMPDPPLREGELRYMVGGRAWYRAIPEDSDVE